jgi:uncharacterized protein YdcH (DUF465 family)
MTFENKIKILKDIDYKCGIYNILCIKSSSYYNKLASFINIPLITFSTGMTVANSSIKDDKILSIFNVIFNLFTAILVVLSSTYKFDSKMDDFKAYNMRFVRLQYDCNKLIDKIKDKNEDEYEANELNELYELNEKVYSLKKIYDDITLNMHDIPASICINVYKTYKNKIEYDKIPSILLAYRDNVDKAEIESGL